MNSGNHRWPDGQVVLRKTTSSTLGCRISWAGLADPATICPALDSWRGASQPSVLLRPGCPAQDDGRGDPIPQVSLVAWPRADTARSDPRRGDQLRLMPAFWVPWVLSGSRPVYGPGEHRCTGYSSPAERPAGGASTRMLGRSYAFRRPCIVLSCGCHVLCLLGAPPNIHNYSP